MGKIPKSAAGLRLARIDAKERLILCEAVRFDKGRPAVITTLNRARISGRVTIGGVITAHQGGQKDG